MGFRTPMYWSRWGERFGFLPHLDITRPVFWLHAVSVGEVEAAAPLINRLLMQLPQYQIVITTVTPTGAQTVQQRFADKVIHLYLPYDLPYSIQRFIRQLQPVMCVVMETELWPNLYHYCYQQKVPIVLANARVSLRSLNGYRKVSALTKKTLACVSQVIAQTKLDADRIISLGCDPARLSIAGNLKFDVNIPSGLFEQAQSMRRELFPNRPVWIAASTHDNEEELVLDAYERILMKHKDCLLILAPRHPQRFNKVADLCVKRGLNVVRKSDKVVCGDSMQVFLLDTLGELQLYYGCADLAFVGGSLVTAGGHNMLEPASLGVPIISGTHVANFHEISNLLLEAGAIYLVKDRSELAEKATLLLTDPKLRQQMGAYGKRLVAENGGSADQTVAVLQSILG
jgi:3-deoxy-D-manno-octulosonic-acid transferase